jgi:hypothetical protein
VIHRFKSKSNIFRKRHWSFKHKVKFHCVETLQNQTLNLQHNLQKLCKCHNPSLGLATKAKVYQGAGQDWAQESHFMFAGVQKSVREWTLTLPSELPLWELKSWWTFEFSEDDCRGQNSLDWRVPSIIGKPLELRCLKWAHMTHLDTSNTSYGQKKGRELNWQFDSSPLKVRNRPDFLACRWRATYRWKALDEGYNFALDLISIKGLHTTLWAPKVAGVPSLGISGLPLGNLGTKCHLDVGLVERHKVYYKGEGGGFPQVWAVMNLVSLSLATVHPSTKSALTMH